MSEEEEFLSKLSDLVKKRLLKKAEEKRGGILSKIRSLGVRGIKIFVKAFLITLALGAGLTVMAFMVLRLIPPEAKSWVQLFAFVLVCLGLGKFFQIVKGR